MINNQFETYTIYTNKIEARHAPEDEVLRLPFPEEDTKESFKKSDRKDRAIANSVESIPLDLIIAWMSVMFGSGQNADKSRKLIIGYTALRVVHTVCYVAKLQPFRTLAWGGSKLCIALLAYDGFKNVSA